jgi:hypothetical protein
MIVLDLQRITSIAIIGTTLLSGVIYDSFGPATGWTWGNGTTASRVFVGDGSAKPATCRRNVTDFQPLTLT